MPKWWQSIPSKPAKKPANILIFQLKDYHTAFNKEEQVLVNLQNQ